MVQVTLAGSFARSISWDAAGNMTSDGALTYGHDAENRLTSVTRTTPSLNALYTYDPLGRRVQRNVNGTATFTLHDGDEEIAEYDATGALIRRFIPGPGTDEPIAIVVPASGGGAPERRYFHEDRIGNVIALSSATTSGTPAPILAEGPFTYDAYGRSPQPLGTSATSTPFRYTGRRLDAETGNYYYRARFYTPTLGQFLETDPVGYADNLNMYAYVGGDPVNSVDPSGLQERPEEDVREVEPQQPQNPTESGSLRLCDTQGCGEYGASRDGGERTHDGVDVLAEPGTEIFAPISGTVRVIDAVYGKDTPDFEGVAISDDETGQEIKIFYVNPSVQTGDTIMMGDSIGTAQDVAAVYPGMQNHVHVEEKINGVKREPNFYDGN